MSYDCPLLQVKDRTMRKLARQLRQRIKLSPQQQQQQQTMVEILVTRVRLPKQNKTSTQGAETPTQNKPAEQILREDFDPFVLLNKHYSAGITHLLHLVQSGPAAIISPPIVIPKPNTLVTN